MTREALRAAARAFAQRGSDEALQALIDAVKSEQEQIERYPVVNFRADGGQPQPYPVLSADEALAQGEAR